MKSDTLVFLLIFFTYDFCHIITWMKNVNNFHIAKGQPQGVAKRLLDFLPISAWPCL